MSWTATARRQAGLVARSQLLASDVPSRTVDHWLRTGRLEATRADGVYRVGGSADTEQSAAWFAALSTRSPVSFLTASTWWGMSDIDDGRLHITRFERRRIDWPEHVRVHRVLLTGRDVTELRGLPVTTRRVTALDCAGWLPFAQAVGYADRALQQGWLRHRDIEERLEETPGRWGNRQLRRLAGVLERGVEAESERRLIRLMRDNGIVGWTSQYPILTSIGTVRADLAFPQLRLVIEVDGYAYHSNAGSFQRDRSKQNALLAAGWRVLRFTWSDVVDRPEDVLRQISQLLAA